jgi:phenylalanine-4-hydroxylase
MSKPADGGIFAIEQIARLPNHLKQYIVEQGYDRYTPIDHAVWRYIMRSAFAFHREHAHDSYVEGLRRTGIGLERIPRIEEMNQILGTIGWGAAPVDGFIPPVAFMEFQAHRVLVIAADIRRIDHLEYTPAPDIVHEAAGHAPIIADPEYAEYLRRFGEYGAKAIPSHADHELYEAIRHLSIIKEAPGTPLPEIEAAQRRVEERQANLGVPSEMARMTRLHWWTVEYGLIGTCEKPKLYGAGLLSSIGEAAYALTDAVRKIPYGIDAADYAFDITRMQPQLFVTSSFGRLNEVLEDFADTMAFRRGGIEGLGRAMESAALATAEYGSGLQASGVVSEVVPADGEAAYLRMSGPCALAFGGRQIPGHGRETHMEGFGSPIGRPIGFDSPLDACGFGDLAARGIAVGHAGRIEFPSGIVVEGALERTTRIDGKTVLLSFSNCRVRRGDRIMFDPSWGTYDMAVGDSIRSVFQGAADKDAYEQTAVVPHERTIKVPVDPAEEKLREAYAKVRRMRERGSQGGAEGVDLVALRRIHDAISERRPPDWLLSLEILEILLRTGADPDLLKRVEESLRDQVAAGGEVAKRVEEGMKLLSTAAPAM